MKQPYEIKDTCHPDWRGQRFASLEQAEKELDKAQGFPGRWELVDRSTKTTLRYNKCP